MGIWSDLWSETGGGGGITQDAFDAAFKPSFSYEPTPPTPEPFTPFTQPPTQDFTYPETPSIFDSSKWGDDPVGNDVIDMRTPNSPFDFEDFGSDFTVGQSNGGGGSFLADTSPYGVAEPDTEFGNFDQFAPENMGSTQSFAPSNNGSLSALFKLNKAPQDYGVPFGPAEPGTVNPDTFTAFPGQQVVEKPPLDGMYANRDLPEAYRQDYFTDTAWLNRWSPDQLLEQTKTTPTVGDAFNTGKRLWDNFNTKNTQMDAILEHDNAIPQPDDFGLEDANQELINKSFFTREEVDALPPGKVLEMTARERRMKETLFPGGAGGDPLSVFASVVSAPGKAVEAGFGKLPGKVAGVSNPLANDTVGEMAGQLTNVLVGALVGGAPGAFAGGMAPVFIVDPETGSSPWDQMSFAQQALFIGNNALNAVLLTKSLPIEKLISEKLFGQASAIGTTAAGTVLNATAPVLTGGASMIIGEDVDWREVVKQAAIWGSARVVFGIAPIARDKLSRETIPDFSTYRGMTSAGPVFGGTIKASRREIKGFLEGLAWLDESGALDVTPRDVQANLILIPKLTSEMRGETPPVAFNAIVRMTEEVPETHASLAASVALAERLEPTIKPIAAQPRTDYLDVLQQELRDGRMAGSLTPEQEDSLLNRIDRLMESRYPFGEQKATPATPAADTLPYKGGATVPALSDLFTELNASMPGLPKVTVVQSAFNRSSPRAMSDAVASHYDADADETTLYVDTRLSVLEARKYLDEAGLPTDPDSVTYIAATILHAAALFESAKPTAGFQGQTDHTYARDALATVNLRNTQRQVEAIQKAVTEDATKFSHWMTDAPRDNITRQTSSLERPGGSVGLENSTFTSGGQAAEDMATAPWSPRVFTAMKTTVEDVNALAQQMGTNVPSGVGLRGYVAARNTMAEYHSAAMPVGGESGGILVNPVRTAKEGLSLWEARHPNPSPAEQAAYIADALTLTLAHEVMHAVEAGRRGVEHGAAFNQKLGILMSGASTPITQIADRLKAELLALSPEDFQRFLDDTARYSDATSAFEPTVGIAARPGKNALRQPDGGPRSEVLQRDSGAASSQGRSVEPRRGDGGAGVRAGEAGQEPTSSRLPRVAGERPGKPARTEDSSGVRTTDRDVELQREGKATQGTEGLIDSEGRPLYRYGDKVRLNKKKWNAMLEAGIDDVAEFDRKFPDWEKTELGQLKDRQRADPNREVEPRWGNPDREWKTAGTPKEYEELFGEREGYNKEKREQRAKSGFWGTINAEEGSALSSMATHVAGTAAGMIYGYSRGDTQEERIHNMLIGGFAGALGMSFFNGGAAWKAKRILQGKPLKVPGRNEVVRLSLKPHELEQLRTEYAGFVDNVSDAELELLVHNGALQTLNAERRKVMLEGMRTPAERLREAIRNAFLEPKPGSQEEVIKLSLSQILGHWDHVEDATLRYLNEMDGWVSEVLSTPEEITAFMFSFEDPLRYVSYFKRNPEAALVATLVSQTLNEWGAYAAAKGLLSKDSIVDPDTWVNQPQNYYTRLFQQLSPSERFEVITGESAIKFGKANIEKYREFDSLAEAMLVGGKNPLALNPIDVLKRYVKVVRARMTALELREFATTIAQDPDSVFITMDEWNALSKSQQTVIGTPERVVYHEIDGVAVPHTIPRQYGHSDYTIIDSPMFINRVDPLAVREVGSLAESSHRLIVLRDRWERLAGYHGKMAAEEAKRAAAASEAANKLENKALDINEKAEVRKESIAALTTSLRGSTAELLNKVTAAAEARGRAGAASQQAALDFGRVKGKLERLMTQLDAAGDTQAGESIEASAQTISTIKMDVHHAVTEEARQVLAQHAPPEVSSAIEDASEKYARKEASSTAFKEAKAAEEAAIQSMRDSLRTRGKVQREEQELNHIELRIARIEGEIAAMDKLAARALRKALGDNGHEDKIEQYDQWLEDLEIEKAAVQERLDSLRAEIKASRQQLVVRNDFAPLFKWTEKGKISGSGFGAGVLNKVARQTQTVLSGMFDAYLIGSHSKTTVSRYVGQGDIKNAVSVTAQILTNSARMARSKTGNAAFLEANEPWMEFFRTHTMGLSGVARNDHHGYQTNLGWIPYYDRLVASMDRAQFEGAATTGKVIGGKILFAKLMADLMEKRGIDPENFDNWLETLTSRFDPDTGVLIQSGEPPPVREVFEGYMRALRASGISQAEIDSTALHVGHVMDGAYGGKDMRLSGMGATTQESMRLIFLTANWMITRGQIFGSALYQLGATPVQMAESVVESVANTGHEITGSKARYQRQTRKPFDMLHQQEKAWAIGTIFTTTAGLIVMAIGASAAEESYRKKKLSGPDWDYVEETIRNAFTDPTHLLEIRDPFSGEYWTPLTWEKDVLRVGIASYYIARPIMEGRIPNDQDLGKAWETIGSYGKARLGILPRTLWNVVIGTNFAGRKISEAEGGSFQWFKDQAKAFLLENQPQGASDIEKATIPADSGLGKWMGQGYENPLYVLLNTLGIGRGRTQTLLDKTFMEDKNERTPDGKPLYPELQDATNYATLDPNSQRQFVTRHPDLKSYLRQGLPDGYVEVSDETKKNMKTYTEWAESGRDGNGDWYYFKEYREDMERQAAIARGASGTLGSFKDKTDEKSKLIASYYELFEMSSTAGKLDSDKFNENFAAWAQGKDKADIDYVFENTQIGDERLMQEYHRAILELKELGAFDIPRHDPKGYKSGKTEEELMDFVIGQKQEIIKNGGSSTGYAAIRTKLRKEWGLDSSDPGSDEQQRLLRDIQISMQDPDYGPYLNLHKEHEGLFAWLRQDLIYDAIVGKMQKEPEDVRLRIFKP